MEENIFTLTRSPYYNEIIKSIKMVYEDNFSAPSVEELGEKLNYFSGFLKNFKNIYEEQKEIQMKTPVIEKENESISRNLKELEEKILKIRDGMKNRDKNFIIKEMISGKNTVNSLFSSFDIIEKIWNEGPKYSEIPVVHEFLRIARGVHDGMFHVKHLQKRRDALSEEIKEKYDELLLLKKTAVPPEIKDEIFIVENLYRELLSGLDEMSFFIKSGDKSKLKLGMELVKINSEKLVSSQKVLEMEKGEPSIKKCFRCGNNNPPQARFCVKCKMEIPEFKQKSLISQMNVKLEGDRIIHGDGAVMTENVYRLIQAVDDFEKGKVRKDQLAATVEWIERKVSATRRQFESHKKKRPGRMSETEKALIEEMEELTEDGISNFEEAVEKFKTAIAAENYPLLHKGLEKASEAGEKLYKVQILFKNAEKS